MLVVGNNELRVELRSQDGYDVASGLNRIELLQAGLSSREQLISRLRDIHQAGWISGRRLSGSEIVPTSAPQAVGYTLEAMLGISANGNNEPDFAGYGPAVLDIRCCQRRNRDLRSARSSHCRVPDGCVQRGNVPCWLPQHSGLLCASTRQLDRHSSSARAQKPFVGVCISQTRARC